jgi:hypothetical protein
MLSARPHLLASLAFFWLFAPGCGSSSSTTPSGDRDPNGAPPPAPAPTTPGPANGGPNAGSTIDQLHGIYVADTQNNRIVYAADIAGSGWTTLGPSTAGSFLAPRDIFISPGGHIYVADGGHDRIVRMDDMTGKGWTTFGTTGSGTNQLGSPFGVVVDSLERIYIADLGNARVVRIDDMNGRNWTTWGTDAAGPFQMNAPERLSLGGDGSKIYVTDTGLAHVARFDSSGTNWEVFGDDGVGPGQFTSPFAISADGSGNFLVGDVGNVRITRVPFGGAGGTQFNWTGGSVDGVSASGGKIYFTDAVRSEVVRIDDLDSTGSLTLGSRGSGDRQFDHPQGIFVH